MVDKAADVSVERELEISSTFGTKRRFVTNSVASTRLLVYCEEGLSLPCTDHQ